MDVKIEPSHFTNRYASLREPHTTKGIQITSDLGLGGPYHRRAHIALTLVFIAMVYEEYRDTDNPPFTPKQLVESSQPARSPQDLALAPARRMVTQLHQLQRCYLYSVLHHNQVSRDVVGVNTYQKVIAKPDGPTCTC